MAISMRSSLPTCADGKIFPPPDPRAVIAFDGNTKSCHWANAGRATSSIQPTCRRFFGAGNDKVLQELKAGTLSNLAKQQRGGAGEEDSKSCSAQLSCSREVAAPRGETDRFGIVGGACGHVFPAKGLFLDMPTPEQHYFYDVLFTEVR